jgi:hypothetical protein
MGENFSDFVGESVQVGGVMQENGKCGEERGRV